MDLGLCCATRANIFPPQEYSRILLTLMQANNNVLKCVVSAEKFMGENSTPVLQHALVWITKIIRDQQEQHTGFVEAKIVFTDENFTKHSDMTDALWKQLTVKSIPLQPLMPQEGGVLIRSAVYLMASPITYTPPNSFVCASKTCHMELCKQARQTALSRGKGLSRMTVVSPAAEPAGSTTKHIAPRASPAGKSHAEEARAEEGDYYSTLLGEKAAEDMSPSLTGMAEFVPGVTALENEDADSAVNAFNNDRIFTSHAPGDGVLGGTVGNSDDGSDGDVDKYFSKQEPDTAVQDAGSRSTGKRKMSSNSVPADFEGSYRHPEQTQHATGNKEAAPDFHATHSGQSVEAGSANVSGDSSQPSSSNLQADLLSIMTEEMLDNIMAFERDYISRHFAGVTTQNSNLMAANAVLVAEQTAMQKRLQDAEDRLQSAKHDTDEIQGKYAFLQKKMQQGYQLAMEWFKPVSDWESAGSAVPSSSGQDTGCPLSTLSTMGSPAASRVFTAASTSALGSELPSTSVDATSLALPAPT